MKKILALALCLTMLSLAACSGIGPKAPVPTDSPAPAPAEETPAAEEAPASPSDIVVVPEQDLSDAPSTLSEGQQALLEQFVFIDDFVTVGTAGSSLRSAAAAASLLDWADTAELDESMIAVIIEFMASKSMDGQTDFDEKLDAVDSMVQTLTGGNEQEAMGLLESAGLEDSTRYPWSEHAVSVIEDLMEHLGRRIG